MTGRYLLAVTMACMLLLAACTNSRAATAAAGAPPRPTPSIGGPSRTAPGLAGMPPLLDRHNIYAADAPGLLARQVAADPALVYVPNSKSGTVDVIDQRTYRVVGHYTVGALPQHVVPSYDLRTLWVNNNDGYSLTPIDPRTGKPGRAVPVPDPYNLYFTPDGKFSIIMAEALKEIIFADAHTMRPEHVLHVPGCAGINHADFSGDGRYFIATCEFAGRLIKVDVARQAVVGTLALRTGAMPQDIKIAPDGVIWYVADMTAGGVWLINGDTFGKVGFLRTGKGAHGLYPRRDAKVLYVTNRGEGSISLISFATRKSIGTWHLPGGGSPDMGGLNAAGTVLWVSGRYNGVVYAIDTADGHLIRTIAVGSGPHGLCVYPQPGRYSLGHTGILR